MSHVPMGDAAELSVNQRDQFLERRLVPVAPGQKRTRHMRLRNGLRPVAHATCSTRTSPLLLGVNVTRS